MGSDKENTDPRYYGTELGTVVDNVDPKGLGRVRLTVPGIIDQPSPWASQIGTMSGGGAQRGAFAVPPIGSDVAVFFHRGDPERPYYMGGHYGEPAGGAEVPEDVKDVAPGDRHHLASFDTKQWKVTFDDRPGQDRLRLSHMALVIDLDGKKGTLQLVGESAISITCAGAINLDSPHVTLCGRVVIQNGQPI